MRWNHCFGEKITEITKTRGEKIYHCRDCGYNFTKQEISKKITKPVEFAPGEQPTQYQNRVNLDGTIVQGVLEVSDAIVKGLF